MADAHTPVLLDRDGLMLVGEFVGTTVRQVREFSFSEIVLKCRKYDGDTYERSVGYDEHDRDTGEPFPIVDQLREIEPGEMVALSVKTRAGRNGNGVFLTAVRATRLPLADLVG